MLKTLLMNRAHKRWDRVISRVVDEATSANAALVVAEAGSEQRRATRSTVVRASVLKTQRVSIASADDLTRRDTTAALFEDAIIAIGVPLLNATSPKVLRHRIEKALRTHSVDAIVKFGRAHFGEAAAIYDQLEVEGPSERELRVFGDAAFLIHRGFLYSAVIARAYRSAEAKAGTPLIPEESPIPDPMGVALGSDVPRSVRDLVFASLCGLPAILALALALQAGEPIAPWLADELARHWLESNRATLRLAASTPGVNVPEAVVPASERLNYAAIDRESAEFRARLDASFERARAAGFPHRPTTDR